MTVFEEIEPHITHLRAEGWCLIDGVIPEHRIVELREHVMLGFEKFVKYFEDLGGSWAHQAGSDGEPETNAVAFVPELAAYFADERVMGVAIDSLWELVDDVFDLVAEQGVDFDVEERRNNHLIRVRESWDGPPALGDAE